MASKVSGVGEERTLVKELARTKREMKEVFIVIIG